MKNKILIALLFLIGFGSCASDEPIKLQPAKIVSVFSNKYSGISIENGPRQGFAYADSSGTLYMYFSITSTITNDTTFPIKLDIAFAKEYDSLRANKSLLAKVFLLPRELTPKQQQFDVSMSDELKSFLRTGLNKSVTLNKTLAPKEKCVMTFGILNNTAHKDPFKIELKFKNQELKANDSLTKPGRDGTLALPLILYLDHPVVIPCGQISFPVN